MKAGNINVYGLSNEQWLRIAGRIDNEFIGTDKTFRVDKQVGYYYLHTNKCDYSSLIRVYHNQEGFIEKITRLGEDTDSWQEIHPNTYAAIKKMEELKLI